MIKQKLIGFAVLANVILVGCAQLPRSDIEEAKKLTTVAQIALPATTAVIGLSDSADMEFINIGKDDLFITHPLQKSDPLPRINIDKVSLSTGRVYEVIRTLLAGKDISFSVSGDANSVMRRSVSAVNISGDLEKILNDLSNSVGFYWRYKSGVIYITPDRQFIAKIAPINELFESLPTMLKTLGATDVFLDKTNRSIVYRADKPNSEAISEYLEYIRTNKSMIIYDTYVWEVVLADKTSTGIQWNKFKLNGLLGDTAGAIGLSGGSNGPANGLGFSSVFSGPHFTLDVLANFLQSQGTLSTISQPKIALISGGSASLRSGKTTSYVSGIGVPTITTGGQVIAGATTTTTLQTGVRMTLSGDISESTIYTKIDILVTDLLAFLPYPAGQGQTLDLPDVAEREVHTTVRAQHNDTVLLAGINYERTNQDNSGLPIPGAKSSIGLPTRLDKQKERSELVIVLRPRIIKFSQRVTDAPKNEVKPS